VEGSASRRGSHNHGSARRVGDPGVDLPAERTSENSSTQSMNTSSAELLSLTSAKSGR
jgi:hypothetical protein